MAKRKVAGVVAGAVGVIGLSGALMLSGQGAQQLAHQPGVPKDASHLWADGGAGLREPLPTLDDGGCQAWAQRCADGKCAGVCE